LNVLLAAAAAAANDDDDGDAASSVAVCDGAERRLTVNTERIDS